MFLSIRLSDGSGIQNLILKLGKVNYKLSQLIAGTFPRQNSKQKGKQSLYWRTTRKRTNQNRMTPKKKFKLVWEKFQQVRDQFVVSLTRL